jgi:hypothetical protein
MVCDMVGADRPRQVLESVSVTMDASALATALHKYPANSWKTVINNKIYFVVINGRQLRRSLQMYVYVGKALYPFECSSRSAACSKQAYSTGSSVSSDT